MLQSSRDEMEMSRRRAVPIISQGRPARNENPLRPERNMKSSFFSFSFLFFIFSTFCPCGSAGNINNDNKKASLVRPDVTQGRNLNLLWEASITYRTVFARPEFSRGQIRLL